MTIEVLGDVGTESLQAVPPSHPDPAGPAREQLLPHNGVHGVELLVLALLELAAAVQGEQQLERGLPRHQLASQQLLPFPLFKANQGQYLSFLEHLGQLHGGDGHQVLEVGKASSGCRTLGNMDRAD